MQLYNNASFTILHLKILLHFHIKYIFIKLLGVELRVHLSIFQTGNIIFKRDIPTCF